MTGANNAFQDLHGISDSLLQDLIPKNSVRQVCTGCNRNLSTYCPFCEVALNHVAPQVNLPINVDIYRHWNEKPQNSTTVYCKLVAPAQTQIFTFHESKGEEGQEEEEEVALLQEIKARYPDPSRVVLLYPTPDAVPLDSIPAHSFDTLAVIDGTWHQAKPMAKVFGSLGFRHVVVRRHETLFWRYQSLDRTFLATIEAIYWFFVDYYWAFGGMDGGGYDGRYDDLLFYFKLKYCVIQKYYKERPGKPFTNRHCLSDSYIQKDDDGDEGDGNREGM